MTLVSLVILGTLVFLLTGGSILKQKATIYMFIPDATGLAAAAPVRVDGIDVGKVLKVELSRDSNPDRVIWVAMTIDRDRLVTIPADTFAQLSSLDLVGTKFVDATSGTSPQHLMPNGEMAFRSQTDFMKSLDISQFEAQLKSVDTVITDMEEGKSRLGQFVHGDGFYQDLRKRTGELQTAVHSILATSTDLGQAMYTDKLHQNVTQPLIDLDQSLAKIQSGQGMGGQLLRDTAQYDQVQKASVDLRETLARLRQSEFLHGTQMYDDWNRMVTGFIQSVDELSTNPMLGSTDTYDSMNGAAKQLRDSIRDLRQDPRKYLRLKIF